MSTNSESVVILGNYRHTLTVVRSLHRAGYRTIVGPPEGRVFIHRSRATAEVWRHSPLASNEARFLDELRDFAGRRDDIRWIFPVGEDQIRFVLRHRDRLPPSMAPVMADPAVIPVCLDKAALYTVAEACGLPCAAYRVVHNHQELLDTVRSLGYPALVKPTSSLHAIRAQKAVILRSEEETVRWFDAWPGEGHETLLVQRYVEGFRHNCHFLAHQGRLLAYLEQRVLRTDRLNGTGFSVDNITVAPSPELHRYCESLLGRLGYSGAGCVQFLVDERRRETTLLEVNPRLDANCAVAYYSGYDFPALALAYARYRRGEAGEPPMNHAPYPAGRRVVWFTGDLAGLWRAARQREVGVQGALRWGARSTGSSLRADFHLTWSLVDPLPSLCSLGDALIAPLRMLFG